ncbi:MAG: beta-galactosidase, partial [Chloroflexales bacterium]
MHRVIRTTIGFALLLAFVFPLQGVRSAPNAASGTTAFGVNSHIASRYANYATLRTPLEVASQSGAGWVREDFQLARMEPKRGTFDWNWADQMLTTFTQRGIQVLGVLNGP